MDHGTLNLEWARRWVAALLRGGVREVQLCPGSRSTPLVLACHERSELRIRVHLDERSAGFFALGYGRRSGRPSVVLTTSGTAVANLLPAAVEAAVSDVPLILMTADRPPSLRGTDANQTVVQPGMFAGYARALVDVPLPTEEGLRSGVPDELADRVVSAASGSPPGPVHLNVAFDKPLHPRSVTAIRTGGSAPASESQAGSPSPRVETGAASGLGEDADRLSDLLAQAERPVLIAGPSSDPDRDGPATLDLALRLGIPLLADPLSGARFTGEVDEVLVSAYVAICGHEASLRRLHPDLILRTGRTFTSASLEGALVLWADATASGRGDPERRPDAGPPRRHVVVDAGSVRKDHLGRSDWYLQRSPAELFPVVERRGPSDRQAWVTQWKACDRAARRGLDEGLAIQGNEAALVAAAVRAAPNGATVFVSNSMPVRDLDWVGDPAWGVRRVLGNRGASGIDGIVSTALGVAAAAVEPVVAILGDLAFLHDSNGFLQARSQDLDAVFVVIDNDGGGIFHMLPIESFEPAFTPYFATPHGLDLAEAARLYDVPFSEADSPEDLAVQVRRAAEAGGVRIVRSRTDRRRNQEAHVRARELVAARLDSIEVEPAKTD